MTNEVTVKKLIQILLNHNMKSIIIARDRQGNQLHDIDICVVDVDKGTTDELHALFG